MASLGVAIASQLCLARSGTVVDGQLIFDSERMPDGGDCGTFQSDCLLPFLSSQYGTAGCRSARSDSCPLREGIMAYI